MVLTRSTDDQRADVAVLGAGPAGLAAATTLDNAGRNVVLLDMGNKPEERLRDSSDDIVAGVGGAGLFSDGKFSFFPAGSKLWYLPDRDALQRAYSWLTDLLDEFVKIPPFPDIPQSIRISKETRELKTYPSIYLDYSTRLTILGRLTNLFKGQILTKAVVEQVTRTRNGRISVTYRQGEKISCLEVDAVVLAFGRLGGLALGSQSPWLRSVFRRYEFGVRLEARSGEFFLQNHKCLDPKFILRDPSRPDVEWRTFCTCRDGEVVETNFRDLRSYSGRSDVERTGLSNVGFNVRIKAEPDQRSKLLPEIANALNGKVPNFRFGLEAYLRGAVEGYGPALDSLLRQGLTLLLEDNTSEFLVIGPCIEGIGTYPAVDDNLRISGAPVWVAGDQTGLFRGLTAAFLSGHYVASQINRSLPSPRDARFRFTKRKTKVSTAPR